MWAPPLREDIGLGQDVPGANRPGVRRSWWRQPWFRALVHLGVLVIVGWVMGLVVLTLGQRFSLPRADDFALISALTGLSALLLGIFVVERGRAPMELSLRRIGSLGVGLALGAALMGASFLIIWLLGGFQVHGTTTGYAYGSAILLLGFQAALLEEYLFRWLLFRMSEEYLGTWLATALSGLVFGLVHIGNPQGTIWGGVAIVLEAGVLFAVIYAATRSMWMVIGLHFAWNVVQGPVLGVTVSGAVEGGFLDTTAQGPDLLSGGVFGAEASVVSVVLCLLLALWMILRLRRRGLVVAPVWVRRRRIREQQAVR